ncbi:hypothetical protein L9W97_17710 [Vibrio aestuarianus]|uniref:hypothetical protein n=1 Tax=Vibrio aestuarianus TaxID=28171 RepID=UPI00237CCDFC|nr:hypothetical protein [Vibrio aestuarianus]MDE1326968.1 hypothetical protein [Vibrio aestuarianus]
MKLLKKLYEKYENLDAAYTNNALVVERFQKYTVGGKNSIVLQVLFSVFSTDRRNIFLLFASSISIFIILAISESGSLTNNIFLSVLAACIFDFVVNRVREERDKELVAKSLAPLVHNITKRKAAILMAVKDGLEREVFDSANIQVLYQALKNLDLHSVDYYSLSVTGSGLIRQYADKKGSKLNSIEFIALQLHLLQREVNLALDISDLKLFEDVYIVLSELKHEIEFGQFYANDRAITSIINFNDDYCRYQFVSIYLLPIQKLEYWYLRKMKKYTLFNLAPRPKFSIEACRYARLHSKVITSEVGGFLDRES